jgi:hypothetical protein
VPCRRRLKKENNTSDCEWRDGDQIVFGINQRAAICYGHTNELLAGWWGNRKSKTKVQLGKVNPIVHLRLVDDELGAIFAQLPRPTLVLRKRRSDNAGNIAAKAMNDLITTFRWMTFKRRYQFAGPDNSLMSPMIGASPELLSMNPLLFRVPLGEPKGAS